MTVSILTYSTRSWAIDLLLYTPHLKFPKIFSDFDYNPYQLDVGNHSVLILTLSLLTLWRKIDNNKVNILLMHFRSVFEKLVILENLLRKQGFRIA